MSSPRKLTGAIPSTRMLMALALCSPLIGCDSRNTIDTQSATPSSAASQHSAKPSPAQVAPHPSTIGCRSPEEPDCSTCLIQGKDGECYGKTWATFPTSDRLQAKLDAAGVAPAIPWYNEVGRIAECTDFPLCAQCSDRNEREALAFELRKECDCEEFSSLDPCHDSKSCDCYCERRQMLHKACPHLL